MFSWFSLHIHLLVFYSYTAWFVSDLVGNPEDRFSHDAANIFSSILIFLLFLTGNLNNYLVSSVDRQQY